MAKSKHKRRQAVESDFGPPEARQPAHGPVVIDYVAEDGVENRNRARRNLTPPLEYYKGRKIITAEQYYSGCALRVLYNQANVGAPIILGYEERMGQGSVQAAREYKRGIVQAYNAALWWVGPRYGAVVHKACCEENFLSRKTDRKKLALGLDKITDWLERGKPERTKEVFECLTMARQ